MYNNNIMNNGQMPVSQPTQMNQFPPSPLPIYCRIEGDKIIQAGMTNGQVIGYTVAAYEEVVKIAEDQEKLLIEHGLMKKELTPEEAMQDLSEKMDRILGSLDSVINRVSALEEMATSPSEVQNEA